MCRGQTPTEVNNRIMEICGLVGQGSYWLPWRCPKVVYENVSWEKKKIILIITHRQTHTHTHLRTLIHSHRSSLVIRPLLRLELGQFMENWSSAVKLGSHCLIFLCQHSLTVSRNDRRQFFFADTHKIGSEEHTVQHGKRPPTVESEKKMGQCDPTFRQDYWVSDWLPFFCLA